jgi:hypothetical protein
MASESFSEEVEVPKVQRGLIANPTGPSPTNSNFSHPSDAMLFQLIDIAEHFLHFE